MRGCVVVLLWCSDPGESSTFHTPVHRYDHTIALSSSTTDAGKRQMVALQQGGTGGGMPALTDTRTPRETHGGLQYPEYFALNALNVLC